MSRFDVEKMAQRAINECNRLLPPRVGGIGDFSVHTLAAFARRVALACARVAENTRVPDGELMPDDHDIEGYATGREHAAKAIRAAVRQGKGKGKGKR